MAMTQSASPKRSTKMVAASVILAGALAMAGCQSMSRVDRATVAGGIIGGGVGVVTAAALGASAGWVIAAGAAGAAAGALIGHNTATNECAYANGDGTYTIAAC